MKAYQVVLNNEPCSFDGCTKFFASEKGVADFIFQNIAGEPREGIFYNGNTKESITRDNLFSDYVNQMPNVWNTVRWEQPKPDGVFTLFGLGRPGPEYFHVLIIDVKE